MPRRMIPPPRAIGKDARGTELFPGGIITGNIHRDHKTRITMRLHAFVAMPFGKKPGPNGQMIDFDAVYRDLIEPAVEAAGLEVFRADQEQRAGDIKADMFQELLIADLVVVDLTLDNPNVWYELGVRHALRARDVVLIQGPREQQPFDIYSDRKLNYRLQDGVPDPASRDQDRSALTARVKATLESWRGRKVSPVYQLLPYLNEPDWKALRLGDAQEYWRQHEDWERRVDLAGSGNRPGDLLVLADEAPISAFRAEAHRKAGAALRKARRYRFALEQLDRCLAVEPDDLPALREKGICLQRLASAGEAGHTLERARTHYREVLQAHPRDIETWALLGRIDKDAWTEAWRIPGHTPERMRDDAAYESALLRAAITSYRTAYRADPAHYFSGINALTLMHLHGDLTGDLRYGQEALSLAGAVRYAAECEDNADQLFWAKATLGDLEVLIGKPETALSAYQEAIAHVRGDWFALDSTLDQLRLLRDLGFRPEAVGAGIKALERAAERLTRPEDKWEPRRVLLFSGHMVDTPDRTEPRFPPDKEAIAAARIAETLDRLDAGSGDLALTQGACGGDILFAEACLARGVKLRLLLPFEEPEFIQRSVVRGGEAWRDRYFAVTSRLEGPPRAAPVELGAPPKHAAEGYAYERCNLWLLYSALTQGIAKVHFICLWNGAGGDGPGGTAHMYQEVKRRTGQVYWLDTRTL